jgi:hypothetical protein
VFVADNDGEQKDVYAYRWRYDIYSHYSIVHAVRLNAENALNKDNFENFLASSLFPEDDKK